VSATVIWRPEAMNARLKAAARTAATEFSRAASAKAATASKRVASSIFVSGTTENFTVGSRHPLGMLFEKGVGPHEITPAKRVLRMADGRFVTGPVRHPGMRAQPFLRPLLPLWPTMYRRHAAGALRGF
jgi:hypothetical protein